MSELRVDFYILEDPSGKARLSLACKLAEKAYLGHQSVLIWHSEAAEIRQLDEMLWTFSDSSFVPHEILGVAASSAEAPVLLSVLAAPFGGVDVLINLADEVPACAGQAKRVVEIVDGNEGRRRTARARFKAYRDQGVQPTSHNIGGD